MELATLYSRAVLLDSLKRSESPLAGNFEGTGSLGTGNATPTGWSLAAEKTNVGATWKTSIECAKGASLAFEIPVLPAIGQQIEVEWDFRIEPFIDLIIKRTGEGKGEATLYGTGVSGVSLGTFTFAAGDLFLLGWEKSGLARVGHKAAAGAWTELGSHVCGIPPATSKPSMYFITNGVAGLTGRVANLAGGSLVLSATGTLRGASTFSATPTYKGPRHAAAAIPVSPTIRVGVRETRSAKPPILVGTFSSVAATKDKRAAAREAIVAALAARANKDRRAEARERVSADLAAAAEFLPQSQRVLLSFRLDRTSVPYIAERR